MAQPGRRRLTVRKRGAVAIIVGALLMSSCADDGSDSQDTAGNSAAVMSGSASSADADAQQSASPGCTAPSPTPEDVPTFAERDLPQDTSADTLTATVATNCGELTIELDGEAAPTTVGSFEFLAGQDYWVNSPCHRLTTAGIWVLQCGDPTGTGRGGPGYSFGVENAPVDGFYPRGTLAMARSSDPNSNGSQFFIVYRDTQLPVEGGGYTVFGRVVDGMDIVDRIAAGGVDGGGSDGAPAQPISIEDIQVTQEEA